MTKKRTLLNRLQTYRDSFSFVGSVFATLFFAASVTPSLLPRIYLVQGALSGIALAVGYGVGSLLFHVYRFLQLPEPKQPIQRIAKPVTLVVVAVTCVAFVWRMTFWQNSIRVLMEMPPLESAYPYRVSLIAILVGLTLVAAARTFQWCGNYFAAKFERVVPRRIALAAGYSSLVFLLLIITNDLIAARLLAAADSFFLRLDEYIDDDLAQPTDPLATGSEESLISWESIGKQGKVFLTTGPTLAELQRFHSDKATAPLRVYVGMRTAETPKERAQLALEELKRVGGFERSVLIIATPTGTGWLDPSAVDTFEYLHGGDTAIVSTQYSYLPSWMTIMVDPRRSIESAIPLFNEIYDYWKSLPHDARPSLYLFGLSLGSLGSESSADLLTIFEDPIQGAVWSGPPFPSRQWRRIVDNRNEESPAWLPTFRDQRIVRFTSQTNTLDNDQAWGPMRFVYVQYASDPMIWFSPELAWSRPAWLREERGADVSKELRWYPIISFLQIGCDIPMATSVPLGYGHNYSPSSYIDAWTAVTQPQNWTPEKTEALKAYFETKEAPTP